mmetsp:Transcript_24545/g.77601  ORF Transcript_24545/g.77601 Transcript_24545/m.77601 type:complete len:230 (-) Transcript_24545:1730-2419(-)
MLRLANASAALIEAPGPLIEAPGLAARNDAFPWSLGLAAAEPPGLANEVPVMELFLRRLCVLLILLEVSARSMSRSGFAAPPPWSYSFLSFVATSSASTLNSILAEPDPAGPPKGLGWSAGDLGVVGSMNWRPETPGEPPVLCDLRALKLIIVPWMTLNGTHIRIRLYGIASLAASRGPGPSLSESMPTIFSSWWNGHVQTSPSPSPVIALNLYSGAALPVMLAMKAWW